MKAVFEMLNLSDDNEIFRGYTTMKELYNALKFITMLLFIQKILTFNLGVAFLKSVSIQVYYGLCVLIIINLNIAVDSQHQYYYNPFYLIK